MLAAVGSLSARANIVSPQLTSLIVPYPLIGQDKQHSIFVSRKGPTFRAVMPRVHAAWLHGQHVDASEIPPFLLRVVSCTTHVWASSLR